MTSSLIASLLLGTPGLLGPTPAQAAGADEADLEILVVSDGLARWRDTRWHVQVQVGMPIPVVLYAEKQAELKAVAFNLDAVMHCDVEARLGPRKTEVMCDVEDASLSVAPVSRRNPNADVVLAETDERLDHMAVRLQVTADGQVTNVNLVGEPEKNRRVNILYENLRQVLSRAFVGFHLQAPTQLQVGKTFYEKNSRLFSIPVFRWVPIGWNDGDLGAVLDQASGSTGTGSTSTDGSGGGFGPSRNSISALTQPTVTANESLVGNAGPPTNRNIFDALQAPATYGNSTVAHRLDRYKGQLLLQSHGEGIVDLGAENARATYQGTLDSVAVLDRDTGIMSERVWTLRLEPTASSTFADGVAGWPYWHQGKLRKLGETERVELGPSILVVPPGYTGDRGQLAPWPVLP